jgi:hypothetical protein
MLGITDKQIREIDLGPRQLFLFDIEDDASADRQRVMDCLAGHVEKLGQADLKDFVQSAGEALGLNAATVLQHLFWLAHDMEINFRSRHGAVPANLAKQMLIDSRQADLRVVLNKPVNKAVVGSVIDFFKRIVPDMESDACHDQTELARCLARLIRKWERTLNDFRLAAGKPGFPGGSDIEHGLNLIASVSAKWDAFSLINAVHAHSGPLAQLAEAVEALSAFYADDAQRWQVMVQFIDACRDTIAVDNAQPAAAADFESLNLIMSSSWPYDRVDEAWQLFRSLKPLHDKITARQTRQCREAARSTMSTLIRKMRDHLDAHGAGEDLRNQSLFALRVKIRSIEEANSVDRIEGHVLDAQEVYETFMERSPAND